MTAEKNNKASSKEKLTGTLCVLAAGICWGTTGTIQAFSPSGASALTLGAARIVFAGAILFLWAFFTKRKAICKGKWSRKGVFLAAAGLAAYQLTFFSAVRLTGVAVGTMVAIGAAPPIAGAFGYFFFGEKLPWRWYAATAMAVTGCALLIAGGSGAKITIGIAGVALAFAAAFSYALEGLGLRFIRRDPYETIAVVSVVSGLMALPWLIAGDLSWMLEPRGALCIALLTLFSTILPYTLFTIGIQNISLGTAYTLGLSEPLAAWVLSTSLLGEQLSVTATTGVGILFAAILLLASGKSGS